MSLMSIATFTQCGKDDAGAPDPTNLTVTTTVKPDGSGDVDIIADAENTKYFKFLFGDVSGELPTEMTFGSVTHNYKESGTYTITVQAHASETKFISATKSVSVQIFIPIPTTGYTTPASYVGMNSIWSDEFAGTTVDEGKWTFELGDGCPNVCNWGNNELQYYQKENATIKEGNLIIEARTQVAGGKSYTSSRMITKNSLNFKYGRVDVRAALPKGQGMWPGIWMLGSNISTVGWPACGEVDIMEMIGGSGREKTVHGTAHWDNAGSTADYGQSYSLTSGIFNDKFHVFTIIWDQDKIQWFVDDVKFNEINIQPSGLSEFRESFFLILNLAVGGNWPGSPDSSTKFPQWLIVDYVRVFQNP